MAVARGTVLVYILPCLFVAVLSVCPHRDRSLHLKKWSSARTWPNGKPSSFEHVEISKHVLLDEQPPELHSINITSSGRLVWSPDVNITLKLKYMFINGRLDIGSEDCPFTAPARIVLKGRRGEFSFRDHIDMEIGDKFIVVADGGTIELHGQKKLPWTKLTRTLPKLSAKNGILFDHIQSGNLETEKYENGLVAYVFNVNTRNHVTVKMYGSYEVVSTWQQKSEQQRLIDMMQNLTAGDVFAMGVHFKLKTDVGNVSTICEALEVAAYGKVTGTSSLRQVQKYDSYTAILEKRADGQAVLREAISVFHTDGDVMDSKSDVIPTGRDVKVSVESRVDQKRDWLSFVNFRVTTRDGAYPKLDLLDDSSTWRPGDRLVLTSTDYDWKQAEEGAVVDCSDCSSTQIRVDLEAKYEHFGQIIDRVDMRAEVALLSRNIVIEGEVEDTCVPSNGNCDKENKDTFGGQLKFLQGSTVHIEGAELFHMGQQTDVGRYPLHFHMGFDMRNVSLPPYLRENSIHHVFSRCVTVHGTHGVTVKDNVCYETRGHAYFIEDGGEYDTVFDGNLVASVRRGNVIPSDNHPTGFWITSPKTSLRNNVAAGGEGNGIWYTFPVEPIGPSRTYKFFQPNEADRTPLDEFDNNVAHSNNDRGLMFDNRLELGGAVGSINRYYPKEDPLNTTSADKEVILKKLTAYKNRYMNVWIRGGFLHLQQASLSDSAKAITMARSSNQNQFLSDSVIIGLSSNTGEPAENLTYSLPITYDRHTPIQGFTFYDGPVWGENIWFDSFKSTDLYKAGAIGYERQNDFSSCSASAVRNAKFGFADGPTTGNRIYDGDEGVAGFSRRDGDKGATNRDYDGSVTGKKNSQIVKPWPYYTTSDCTYRPNWNMAVCPHEYGKLRVDIPKKDRDHTYPIMVRDDIPEVNETMTGVNSADFMVILGDLKTYTLHWTNFVPETFSVYSDGLEKNKNVRFGLCLPKGATFDLYTYSPHYLPSLDRWHVASSLSDLDSTLDGRKYYHDQATGMLYFNFALDKARERSTTSSCPGTCPMVTIKNISGNRHDADCRTRLYHTTRSADNRAMNLRTDIHHYSATMAHPPSTWGAGPTKPFINRIPVDGGWGQWSDWDTCSLTCGGGQQVRSRACDSPLPAHGGLACAGAKREQRACSTQHCPVDGGFSEWGRWSTCVKTSGCQGYKKRSRTCSQPLPNYGGQYCHGSDEEVDACTVC